MEEDQHQQAIIQPEEQQQALEVEPQHDQRHNDIISELDNIKDMIVRAQQYVTNQLTATCPVCYEEFNDKEMVILKCGHVQ